MRPCVCVDMSIYEHLWACTKNFCSFAYASFHTFVYLCHFITLQYILSLSSFFLAHAIMRSVFLCSPLLLYHLLFGSFFSPLSLSSQSILILYLLYSIACTFRFFSQLLNTVLKLPFQLTYFIVYVTVHRIALMPSVSQSSAFPPYLSLALSSVDSFIFYICFDK